MSDDKGGSVLDKFRKHGKKGEPQPIAKIEPAEYHEGQIRRDEFGVGYWMTKEQLTQLAKLNTEIDDDKDFWKAFRELRIAEKIKPMSGGYYDRRSAYNFDDDDAWFGNEKPYTATKWTDPTKNKGYLSEWWTGFKSWGGGASETKLALALKAAQTVINVIDDTGKTRMHVRFAEKNSEPINYTDFHANQIVVSPKPILDGKLKEGEAIDVISGEGLHEGSHAKYSRKVIGLVEKDPRIDPLAIAALLVNILEDVRIEAATSREFPGFAPYFEKTLAYMWGLRKGIKAEYGPDLASKLNTMIGYCKWPEKYPQPEHADELKWWTDWHQRYAPDGGNSRELAIEGIDHLREPTPPEEAAGKDKSNSQASQDLDKQTEQEEALRKAAADLNAMIRDFLERADLDGFCTHTDPHEKNDAISEEMSRLIQRRLEEEIEQQRTPVPASGAADPQLVITKPLESERSKSIGSQPAGHAVKKYRRALLFRPAKPIHSLKLTKAGKVDPTQLWRWAGDDWRVFQKREINSTPSARLYLLVDMSGSMSGPKLRAAKDIALLFTTALTSIDGVHPKVFGHTGDIGETQCEIYRLWEPGDPLRRLGLINALDHGNNYDGHAIAYVVKQVEQDSQPGEQRIVIVLSDGIPSGSGYGGTPGMAHVRKVVGLAEKHQVRVLQIAIDESLDKARQDAMFDEYIPFRPGDSLDDLPRRLTKWLEKIL